MGGLQHDAAPARRIGVADTFSAPDVRAGGKVGPRNMLHQIIEGGVRMRNQMNHRVADLGEVVRRDVRRHSDRDAGRAVDQEVRKRGGQNGRLLERGVEVIRPVHRFAIDVAEHLVGDARQARLRVPHRGRRVAVYAAKVALAGYERVAQREILRHPDHRLIYR